MEPGKPASELRSRRTLSNFAIAPTTEHQPQHVQLQEDFERVLKKPSLPWRIVNRCQQVFQKLRAWVSALGRFVNTRFSSNTTEAIDDVSSTVTSFFQRQKYKFAFVFSIFLITVLVYMTTTFWLLFYKDVTVFVHQQYQHGTKTIHLSSHLVKHSTYETMNDIPDHFY